MSDSLHTIEILRAGTWKGASDIVVIRHDERVPNESRLQTVSGQQFKADLGAAKRAHAGDAFRLNDGQIVEVVAAAQDLLAINGELPRLAWHIGRCHAACQVEASRLLIAPDAALESLMRNLGATIQLVYEPFTPERETEAIALPEISQGGAAAGKRHVHFHVSRLHDADEDELPDVPAANA